MTRTEAGSYRRDAAVVAFVLAGILAVVFAPFLFGGKTLMTASRDVASIYPTGATAGERPAIIAAIQRTFDYSSGWQYEPDIGIQHRLLFVDGAGPFWNPYQGFGAPLAAAMQPQPFAPLTFLESLKPSPVVHDLHLVTRLFVAGFFAGLFVLLFAGRSAALAAAVACAFTGYFGSYYDMPHISVEMLFPAFLWATELAVRRPTARRTAVLAVVAGLDVLGGMPESTLLAFSVVGAYAAVRVWMLRRDGPLRLRLAALCGGGALGCALGGVMVIPFFEYLPWSFDAHQTTNTGGALSGLAFDHCLPGCLVQHFAPLALGPPWNDIRTNFEGAAGLQGAFGLVVTWLALLAVVPAVHASLSGRARAADGVVLFLAAATLLLIGKRFGLPLVQWMGALPGYRVLVFVKYVEAPAGCCAAILAGFGIDALARALRERRRYAFVDALVLGIFGYAYAVHRQDIPSTLPHAGFFFWSVAWALGALLVAMSARTLAARGAISVRAAVAAVVVCVGLEAAGGYVIPMFYIVTEPPPASDDPYTIRGHPFISTIARRLAQNHMRVLGAHGIFFGDWAGVFGLDGANSVDAMYPRHFLRFVGGFHSTPKVVTDLSGNDPPDIATELGRRWLALSSIEYVVEPAGYPAPLQPSSTLAKLWDQNVSRVPAQDAPRVHVASERIGGVSKHTLFEHPPFHRVTYRSRIDARSPIFAVEVGIAPQAYRQHECAAAVRFRLEATDLRGGRIGVRERLVDPKRVVVDRAWRPLRLDLSRFAGRDVVLRFTTAAGPSGELCYAWAHWGEPRFVDAEDHDTSAKTESAFEIRSDPDATIVRYRAALPRATFYRDVRTVRSDDEALALLRSPGFDVRKSAVVVSDAGGVSFQTPKAACGGDDHVVLTSERPTRVQIASTLACPALVMLNDTWFPGWTARIDGTAVPVLRADEAFRGVVMPGGAHELVFTYESKYVRAGSVTSIGALLAIAGLVLSGLRVRRKAAPSSVRDDATRDDEAP